MYDFSKASDVEKYFDEFLNQIKNNKVKAIFSLYPSFRYLPDNKRIYSDYSDVYLLLDNDMCLVISYLFIDSFEMQYRKLTKEEFEIYNKTIVKDYFNCNIDVYNSRTGQISEKSIISLEYDAINKVETNRITREYQKWLNGDIDFVKPTKETFDEIKFIMNNGKSFIICADEADVDGYCMTWSDDAKMVIQKFDE